MRQLWTIVGFDLRQRIRDKSVIIFGLVVPLALMGVLNMLFSGFDEDAELEPVTVAVSVPDNDHANRITETLSDFDGTDVTVEHVPAGDVRDRVDDGDADLGLTASEAVGASTLTEGEPRVEIVEGNDGGGLESDVLISVVQEVVAVVDYIELYSYVWALSGAPADDIVDFQAGMNESPPVTLEEGEASDEQLSTRGMLVAGQTGLFLLFTVGFGVLALLAEREQGTLARLRSMPMRPSTVVAAKALTGFLLGVFATSFLLLVGSLLFGVDFGSLVPVAALTIGVVAAATSLTFIVARIARTAEQANIVQSIIAVVLGMAGGAFFPIQATGWAGTIIDLNPIAAFIRGLGITSGGGGLADVGTPLLIMAGFAVAAVLASRLIPDRTATT